jgi:hypothetical protein
MNQLCKPIKSALSDIFGYKNVSVKNDRGTAWGWVKVEIEQPKPAECSCQDWHECEPCRNLRRGKEETARNAIYDRLTREGMKLYTYTSDDGYNTERDCLIIDVKLI